MKKKMREKRKLDEEGNGEERWTNAPPAQFHVIPAHGYIVVGAGVSLTAIRDNFSWTNIYFPFGEVM